MSGHWDTLLDGSIYFSFDQSGFARHAREFDPTDLQVDLSGKTCLVTGANSGIGFATARSLAQRGARVHLLCRSRERGQAALDALRDQTWSVALQRASTADRAALWNLCAELTACPSRVSAARAGRPGTR